MQYLKKVQYNSVWKNICRYWTQDQSIQLNINHAFYHLNIDHCTS